MFKENKDNNPKRRHWQLQFIPCFNVSIVNFEQVNADWEYDYKNVDTELKITLFLAGEGVKNNS